MKSTCGLYIHVPFCRHKCNYCDFYSTTQMDLMPRYLAALLQEIDLLFNNPPSGGFDFSTLYLGGGTPSLLSPQHIETIFAKLAAHGSIHPQAEITLEANPGALDDEHLAAYRHAGINRLSLGIQSFIDCELAFLQRIHTAAEAKASFRAARQAGFDNISLDLIFALPGQSLSDWYCSLQQALELAPEHVSMYGLTIEEGTPLHRTLQQGLCKKIDEELEREMYLSGKETLEAAGYRHYEISNFARPGREAQHNQHYWDGSPYIGFGPAAHSFADGQRWWNVRDVNAYCRSLLQGAEAVAGRETLDLLQLKAEAVLLGLRRREGIDLAAWEKRFTESALERFSTTLEKVGGCDHETPPFQKSKSHRLFTHMNDHLGLTTQGILLYDYLCRQLYEVLG